MIKKAVVFDPENWPTLFVTNKLEEKKWGKIKLDLNTGETN